MPPKVRLYGRPVVLNLSSFFSFQFFCLCFIHGSLSSTLSFKLSTFLLAGFLWLQLCFISGLFIPFLVPNGQYCWLSLLIVIVVVCFRPHPAHQFAERQVNSDISEGCDWQACFGSWEGRRRACVLWKDILPCWDVVRRGPR